MRIKWQKNVNDIRKTDMKENIKRMPTDRGRTDSDTVSKEAKAAVPPSDAEGAPDRNEACPPVSKVASVAKKQAAEILLLAKKRIMRKTKSSASASCGRKPKRYSGF